MKQQPRVLAYHLAKELDHEALTQVSGGAGGASASKHTFKFTGAIDVDIVYDF